MRINTFAQSFLILVVSVALLQANSYRAAGDQRKDQVGIHRGSGDDMVPEGWYRGNTHTHSDQSDGDNPPEEVAAHYRSLGYDFLVLTDHNIVVSFSQYSTSDYLCIDGEEITHDSNHTNGLDLTRVITPGSIEENIDSVLVQGGVPHLNHLTYSSLTASDVLSVIRLELMEIFNGRTDDHDENIWDEILTAGKRLYAVAADDCHLLYTEAGKGWVMVRADSLTRDDILGAIAEGDFYATTGVILNDYYVDPERLIVDSQNGEKIKFIGRNGQVFLVVNGPYGEYVFTGSEGYVRARVQNNLGQYAWTQPVFLPGFDMDPNADYVVGSQGVSTGSPDKPLGPPYKGKVPSDWEKHSVRIDTGGYLVLDMGEEENITDREGPDLYIEEVDQEDGIGSDDPYHVYLSTDTLTWVYIGEGQGDSYFDLDGVMPRARYLQITVEEANAEVDAVEANFTDPYADWVLDYSGMISGYPRYVLGPPTPGPIGDPWENYGVRIEQGGFLILDLGPDEEVVDGPGVDLYIEEVDSEDDSSFTEDTYFLYGSMDQVHWTEIGQGLGDTAFDLPEKLPWVRYLKLEPADTDVEFDGVWARNACVNSRVVVTLTPDEKPVIIPPEGGSFGYRVTLENVTDESQNLTAWIMALLPNGINFGPALGPAPLTLQAGAVLSVHLTQTVPAQAPAGQYFFTGYVGSFPLPLWDVSGFVLFKE